MSTIVHVTSNMINDKQVVFAIVACIIKLACQFLIVGAIICCN
jgi:hypothetical protein